MTNFIIEKLQDYEKAWQKIFEHRGKIHLEFNHGNINVVCTAPGTQFIVNRTPTKKQSFAFLVDKYKELLSEWQTIKRVEYWLEHLTFREREALFWKYINHDFEPPEVLKKIEKRLKEFNVSVKTRKQVTKMIFYAIEDEKEESIKIAGKNSVITIHVNEMQILLKVKNQIQMFQVYQKWQTLSEQKIADKMGISRSTLRSYLKSAFEKIERLEEEHK